MSTDSTPTPTSDREELTGRIMRGADRFRAAASPTTTSRIRRSVTGRVENRGLPGEPIRVVCTSCGQTFVAVARQDAVQVPCIHCGRVQAIAL